MSKKMLLVGGGQEYHGATAARDQRVVALIAQKLFDRVGNSLTILTGGMPGVGMDFARAWLAVGGKHVKFIVSEEYMDTLENVEMGVEYNCAAKTQAERRQALTQWPGLTAALFVQGGQYTTDEIIKCQNKGIPTVCFLGSGGASGGAIAYKNDYPRIDDNAPEWMKNVNPEADAEELAAQFAEHLCSKM